MYQIEFFALGTKWWLSSEDLITVDKWEQVTNQAQKIVWHFNNSYSRFLETSLVGQLNKNHIITEFDAEFLEIIVIGQKVKQLSGGYFDISIAKDLDKIGYDSSFNFSDGSLGLGLNRGSQMASETKIDHSSLCDNVFKQINISKIEINPDYRVDLGGLGKGWLVDKLTDFFRSQGLRDFTINGGGDIYSTSGEFYLENPFDSTESIGIIQLNNSAIACSSPNRRRFADNDHHLINPKTHQSQNTFAAVFTQSGSALMADIASTTLFVSPISSHSQIANSLGVEYMLVNPDGSYLISPEYKGVMHV
jgi:FAD:protein FMN transferase